MQIKTEGDKYDKNFGKKYQRFRQRIRSDSVLYETRGDGVNNYSVSYVIND